jgi:hypothetical protein
MMWARRSCPLIDNRHYRRCRMPGCKAGMAASASDGSGRLIRSNGSSRRALRPAHPLRRWRVVMWPSLVDGTVTISSAQLSYLLAGIDWRMPQEIWRPTAVG